MIAELCIQPLLAIGLSDVLIGLAALIFVIIRQLLEANKNAGLKAKPPAVAPPQPAQQAANRGAAPAAGQQADPLRAQVEEFLRRAGRPAPQNQPRPTPARESEIEVLVQPKDSGSPRNIGPPLRQADWRQTAASQPSDPPEKSRFSGRDKRKRKSVAEHVAEQVTSRAQSVGAQASQLGDRIVAEDQQFDRQIKARFDHQVGTLTGSDSAATNEPTPPAIDSPAAQLAAMLASPGGIRQAVLLNEILRRPSDRW